MYSILGLDQDSRAPDMTSICTFKTIDYLNFCFFKATKSSDSKRLFEGTGKGIHHVKIKSEKILMHHKSNCG